MSEQQTPGGDGGSSDGDTQPDDTGATGTLADTKGRKERAGKSDEGRRDNSPDSPD